MRAVAVVPLALLALASCRETIKVDTTSAESIPSEVAVAKLRELLPQVDFVTCRAPKATIEHEELKDWKIDAKGVGFRFVGKDAYRFQYSEIVSTQLDKVAGGNQTVFQVRLFMKGPDPEPKDLFRFNWADQDRARKVLELFESLRLKR